MNRRKFLAAIAAAPVCVKEAAAAPSASAVWVWKSSQIGPSSLSGTFYSSSIAFTVRNGIIVAIE